MRRSRGGVDLFAIENDVLPHEAVAIARRGGRIGLLGGSFNPAHDAHRHISEVALRRLKLDCVWWLVSPQNPLKPTADMAPITQRVVRARQVSRTPHVFVTTIETAMMTSFAVDSVTRLQSIFPQATFVWLMGGDNMMTFHLWKRWRHLAEIVPIAVIARPNATIESIASRSARRLEKFRVVDAEQIYRGRPPVWLYLSTQLSAESSTRIRKLGLWATQGAHAG